MSDCTTENEDRLSEISRLAERARHKSASMRLVFGDDSRDAAFDDKAVYDALVNRIRELAAEL